MKLVWLESLTLKSVFYSMQHIATRKDLIRKNKNSVHFQVLYLLKLLVGEIVVLYEK